MPVTSDLGAWDLGETGLCFEWDCLGRSCMGTLYDIAWRKRILLLVVMFLCKLSCTFQDMNSLYTGLLPFSLLLWPNKLGIDLAYAHKSLAELSVFSWLNAENKDAILHATEKGG